MRFLIQKINREIRHDFSFTLLESVRFQEWLQNDSKSITVKYIDSINNENWWFKPFHQHYVPVGSVEFVSSWMQRFGVPIPRPINIPIELFNPNRFTARNVFNGNQTDSKDLDGVYFVKSNSKIKKFAEFIRFNKKDMLLPVDEYQISEVISIHSEWRAFVYNKQLVGLQNYSGDFTKFPETSIIFDMINNYHQAPVAYTLDVGVNNYRTFIIEAHDFFSCGLYGFADHKTYPFMLYRWFQEYLKK